MNNHQSQKQEGHQTIIGGQLEISSSSSIQPCSTAKPRRQKRRRRKGKEEDRHRSILSAVGIDFGENNNKRNCSFWVFFFLVTGLVLCWIVLVYLFYMTHHHHQSPKNDGNEIIIMGAKKGALAHMTLIHHNKATTTAQRKQKQQQTDRDPIQIILEEADLLDQVTPEIQAKLPKWDDIVAWLGPEPKIYGLDTCQDFQANVQPPERFIAPAGIFNSGTNLMAELLIANCINPERIKTYGIGNAGVRWQVNWGKHQPARFRNSQHAVYNGQLKNNNNKKKRGMKQQQVNKPPDELDNTHILPVVTIRHPYSWMQSMCRHRYATHWFHEAKLHCPNLVPNHVEEEFYPRALDKTYLSHYRYLHENDPWLKDNVMNTANYTPGMKAVPVYVKYKKVTTNHDSLIHFWNEWFEEYYTADFPRVMVRFEDLIFHGHAVTKSVCECMGGILRPNVPFRHVGQSAKKGDDKVHGHERTSLLDAILRYGKMTSRDYTRNMTVDDLQYAKTHLSETILTTFGYHHPNE